MKDSSSACRPSYKVQRKFSEALLLEKTLCLLEISYGKCRRVPALKPDGALNRILFTGLKKSLVHGHIGIRITQTVLHQPPAVFLVGS